MSPEISFVTKGLGAMRTRESTWVVVRLRVVGEEGRVQELPITESARMWRCIRMLQHMLSPLSSISKSPFTITALEGEHRHVTPHMLLEMLKIMARMAAVLAAVWLIAVAQHMKLKLARLIKRQAAHRALVRIIRQLNVPMMTFHMRS